MQERTVEGEQWQNAVSKTASHRMKKDRILSSFIATGLLSTGKIVELKPRINRRLNRGLIRKLNRKLKRGLSRMLNPGKGRVQNVSS